MGDTKVFAAVYGNASEYETGSHVKVNGWSGIVGVGKTNDNGLTVGAFFENGTGNYRTYNTVDNEFMRGDGEATYNGGGFLVRKDNANGVYTEASFHNCSLLAFFYGEQLFFFKIEKEAGTKPFSKK